MDLFSDGLARDLSGEVLGRRLRSLGAEEADCASPLRVQFLKGC